MTWTVIFSDEYEKWFGSLDKKDQTAIATDLGVLETMGPTLGRPYVDQVNDSQYANMKELRTKVSSHVYRSFFAFDPDRQAIVLNGGDKKGKDQKKFYKRLIAEADTIFTNYLQKQKRQKQGRGSHEKTDK